MKLSVQQLKQFDNDGYLVLRGFVDAQTCDAILETAKEHLREHIEPIETETEYNDGNKEDRTNSVDYHSKNEKEQTTVRRLRQVYDRDKLFKNWMKNEKIRPLLQQILKDQVVITTAHHNSIMTKIPQKSTATAWHQDRRYWRFSDNNLVSVWLALDDEDSKNGVLEFIAGSHKMHFDANRFDKKEYFSETLEENKVLISEKVSTDLSKGDVVIFHSLLLHRANKNNTDKPKISFVYTVKGKKTKAIKGTRSSEFAEIELQKLD